MKLPDEPSPVPDFDLRSPEADHPDRLSNDRMLHVIHVLDMFEFRILEEDAWRERPRDRDVDILP